MKNKKLVCSTLRPMHSPPRNIDGTMKRLLTPEHVDSGFFTFVTTFNDGLQVHFLFLFFVCFFFAFGDYAISQSSNKKIQKANKTPKVFDEKTGLWHDVGIASNPSKKNEFLVVNIGLLMSKISNFKLKATQHRVLSLNEHRYSMGFFFEPQYNAKFMINDTELQYGKWLSQRLLQFAEYNHEQKNYCFFQQNKTSKQLDCQKLP